MEKEKNKRMLILVISIVVIIILAIIAIVYFVGQEEGSSSGTNQNSQNSNKSGTALSEVPEKILYRPSTQKQIYFNQEGEMINLEDTITTGQIETSEDFSYGTGVITQNGKYAIVNYNGEIVVDYDTYKTIRSTDYNFIAETEENKKILLDKNGKQIGDTEYNTISQLGTDTGLYYSQNYSSNTNDIFTATGCYIGEAEGTYLNSNAKTWTEDRNFTAIWINNSDVYVIDKTNFEGKLHFKSNNIGVGYKYITDIEHNVTYVFDEQGNSVLELKDCLIEEDTTWNAYQSVYRGGNVDSYADTTGYVIYDTNDNKTKIIYKDGTTIGEYASDSLPEYYMGQDYLFINNGSNVDVYNKSQKVTTIENRTVINPNILLQEVEAQNQIVPLSYEDSSNMRINLYRSNGEALNNITYIWNGGSDTVLESEDGASKIKPLANGELMDAKDYSSIKLLVNKSKENEYSNNYFRATWYDNSGNDKYYLIDKEGNRILELDEYGMEDAELFEDNGIFVYENTEGSVSVYDINANREILKGGNASYLKDFNIIIIGSSTIAPDYVYALTQNQLYNLNEM